MSTYRPGANATSCSGSSTSSWSEGGRLIIGTYPGESVGPDSQERELIDWGFTVAGHTSRPHRDARVVYRALWIDA